MSRKFCAVGDWRPPEQTWMCECENFPGHRFVLHFECEKIELYFFQSFDILNFGHEFVRQFASTPGRIYHSELDAPGLPVSDLANFMQIFDHYCDFVEKYEAISDMEISTIKIILYYMTLIFHD